MPLSIPAPREQLHNRQIECIGYKREDGLWDIEAHLHDSKAYDMVSEERGEMKSGDPIHHMWVRLTVDDHLVIHAAEASTDASPYQICGNVTAAFEGLKGLQIGSAWTREALTRGIRHAAVVVRAYGQDEEVR